MTIDPQTTQFVSRITAVQNRLYAYFMAVTGDPDAADDLVQNTNVVLCRKSDQFEPGTDFAAWAMSIARYEALEHRRRTARSHVVFDERVASQIEDVAAAMTADMEEQIRALQECLRRLSQRHRSFVEQRYACGRSVVQIAEAAGMTPNAVAQLLHRARASLATCIESQLGEGTTA